MRNVLAAGGSGLIFAQYAANSLDVTANSGGIACVLVDIDTGNRILKYMRAARYTMHLVDYYKLLLFKMDHSLFLSHMIS